jgi:hypothetical protein
VTGVRGGCGGFILFSPGGFTLPREEITKSIYGKKEISLNVMRNWKNTTPPPPYLNRYIHIAIGRLEMSAGSLWAGLEVGTDGIILVFFPWPVYVDLPSLSVSDIWSGKIN